VKTNTLLKTESKPWKNKESIICTETQEIWKVSAQSPPFKPTSEEVKKETFWTDWTTGRKASFTSTLTCNGCQDCSGSQTRPSHQQFTWKECQRLRRKPKSFQFPPTSILYGKKVSFFFWYTIYYFLKVTRFIFLKIEAFESSSSHSMIVPVPVIFLVPVPVSVPFV
jgi:hypothetical protein